MLPSPTVNITDAAAMLANQTRGPSGIPCSGLLAIMSCVSVQAGKSEVISVNTNSGFTQAKVMMLRSDVIQRRKWRTVWHYKQQTGSPVHSWRLWTFPALKEFYRTAIELLHSLCVNKRTKHTESLCFQKQPPDMSQKTQTRFMLLWGREGWKTRV